jgi:hypothetical protein
MANALITNDSSMRAERSEWAISSTEGIELGQSLPTNFTSAYGNPATRTTNATSALNPRILCDI